jgi:hypothetical protein
MLADGRILTITAHALLKLLLDIHLQFISGDNSAAATAGGAVSKTYCLACSYCAWNSSEVSLI